MKLGLIKISVKMEQESEGFANILFITNVVFSLIISPLRMGSAMLKL